MDKKALLFYITLFLLILAFTVSVNNFDYDLWARLIAGMGVVDGGHVLTQDFLSYTPVHTWWDHEWGAGVIFYACLKYFGAFSLIILQALMLFGIFFTASKVVKLRGSNTPYNILFYFFAFMSVRTNLSSPVRCHMFSFLFFVIFIYILEKVRKTENNKLLYIIPFMLFLWNNIHGGVVAGLGLLGMYAIGEFLNKKPFAKYLIILGISAPLLLINPWGWQYIKFLLMANTMPRPYIAEWNNLFSNYFLFKLIPFKAFMLGSVITEGICIGKNIKINSFKDWYNKADKVKYIVLLATLYLAISHIKLLPFFVITTICFVYDDFFKLIENIKLPTLKANYIYAAILFISFLTFAVKDISVPVGMDIFPVKEVEFVKINNIEGKILTNFDYGSYVAYKLYPQNKIYMDGRYEEVYYDYMLPILKEFFFVYPNWRQLFTYFNPDVMILEKSYKVYNTLKNGNEWVAVYEGKKFGVFVPKDKVQKSYKKPTDDMDYYKNTLFTTSIKF